MATTRDLSDPEVIARQVEAFVPGVTPLTIDGSPDLSRGLMYAMMRNESQFYARAISSIGALGLFQFVPTTFEELNKKWKVTELNGPSSVVDYLLDPAHKTLYVGPHHKPGASSVGFANVPPGMTSAQYMSTLVQKLTDAHTKTIDELLKHKEAEVMEV